LAEDLEHGEPLEIEKTDLARRLALRMRAPRLPDAASREAVLNRRPPLRFFFDRRHPVLMAAGECRGGCTG
jgi:hypothetical protein